MSGPMGAAYGGMIDRIVDVKPHDAIRATKNLSYRETYLRDHFPGFPLMPGAMQLECMIQAGQWLLRVSHEFPPCDFFPRVVKNTRYSRFVIPGDSLEVEVSITKTEGDRTAFKGEGRVDGAKTIVARFELVRYEPTWTRALHSPEEAARMIQKLQSSFRRLREGALPMFTGASL